MSQLLANRTTRRTFLAAGAATVASARVLGRSRALGALGSSNSLGTTTTSVWRLNPDWGYPLGPKGRTSVSSKASRLHAENKIFSSEAAARAGRLSPCSLAQPYSVELCAADYDELWTHSMDNGVSVDMRCPGVPEILARAGVVCATPTAKIVGVPAVYSPMAPPPPMSAGAENTAGVDAAARTKASDQKAPAGSLPVTGSSSLNLAAAGAGILAVGAIAAAAGRSQGNTETPFPVEGSLQEPQ